MPANINIFLDNIIFSLQKSGGISLVWSELIKRLEKSRLIYPEYIEYDNHNIHRREIKIPDKRIIKKDSSHISCRRYLPPRITIKDSSIFHSSYYRTYNAAGVKNITTLHDFTYEYYFSGIRAIIHKWQKFSAIKHSDVIVCISENTKKDLLKFIPEARNKKIEVIYNGVSDDFFISENSISAYSDCLLFIGSRASYKNFEFAVHAANEAGLRLLICGAALTSYEVALINKVLGENRYIVKVYPTSEELNIYYNSVFGLIYPSSYEGFGLPVIEAQKANCPVFACKNSSIPEIIGSEYPMIDGLTIESFKTVLKTFSSPQNREALCAYGNENAKRFTWDKMANDYMSLYTDLS